MVQLFNTNLKGWEAGVSLLGGAALNPGSGSVRPGNSNAVCQGFLFTADQDGPLMFLSLTNAECLFDGTLQTLIQIESYYKH